MKCRVCDKDKKEFKWRNGLQGGQCKKNDEGRLVDFGKKGKKYKDVSCLLFTDGERTWRGVINKIIPDKCYYHGPSVSLIGKKKKQKKKSTLKCILIVLGTTNVLHL